MPVNPLTVLIFSKTNAFPLVKMRKCPYVSAAAVVHTLPLYSSLEQGMLEPEFYGDIVIG